MISGLRGWSGVAQSSASKLYGWGQLSIQIYLAERYLNVRHETRKTSLLDPSSNSSFHEVPGDPNLENLGPNQFPWQCTTRLSTRNRAGLSSSKASRINKRPPQLSILRHDQTLKHRNTIQPTPDVKTHTASLSRKRSKLTIFA